MTKLCGTAHVHLQRGLQAFLSQKGAPSIVTKGERELSQKEAAWYTPSPGSPGTKLLKDSGGRTQKKKKSGIIRAEQMIIPLQQELESALYVINVLFFPEKNHLHSTSIT